MLFTPSTDPTPAPATPLLLFIQQAQLSLVYPERMEIYAALPPQSSKPQRAA
jgi:hypothetical protein